MKRSRSSSGALAGAVGTLAVAALYGTAIVWAVVARGATEDRVLYPVFLLLVITGLVACAWRPASVLRDKRFLLVGPIGIYLLLHTAWQPTLESRGYLVAAVGWLSLFLTLRLACEGPTLLRTLAGFLVLIGVAEALQGIGQAVGSDQVARGTMINYSHYAALLHMTLLLAVGVVVTRGRARVGTGLSSEHLAVTWLLNLVCAIVGVAVLLSGSRGGTLALVLSLAFVSFALFLKRRLRSRGPSMIGGWILLATILALGGGLGIDLILSRFAEIKQTGTGRPVMNRDSLKLIAEEPFVGVGPGMYRWRIRQHQTGAVRFQYVHAHNDYLEIAAEWGIPLAALFWGFVGWRFYRSAYLFLWAKERWRSGLALGCAAAIFSILVHSAGNFNLHIPGNLMVFCAIVGLGWGLERSPETSEAGS